MLKKKKKAKTTTDDLSPTSASAADTGKDTIQAASVVEKVLDSPETAVVAAVAASLAAVGA